MDKRNGNYDYYGIDFGYTWFGILSGRIPKQICYIGYISGNNVYNRSGSLIGRVNRVPDLIVALVYFYGYFPLR